MNLFFEKLTNPNISHVEVFNRWDNDPVLIPLTRPNQNKEALERQRKHDTG